jgi:hypothetical protein
MERLLKARRENLRRVVKQLGGPTATAKLLGHSNGSFLPQLIGPNPGRDISEKVARDIEEKLRLPLGSLDSAETADVGSTDSEGLSHAITLLLNELGHAAILRIDEQKFADLCAAVLCQYREAGRVTPSFIQRIVRLAQGAA